MPTTPSSQRRFREGLIDAIRRVLDGKLYISTTVAEQIAARSVGAKGAGSQNPIELLSDRELEVFEMLGQGPGGGYACGTRC